MALEKSAQIFDTHIITTVSLIGSTEQYLYYSHISLVMCKFLVLDIKCIATNPHSGLLLRIVRWKNPIILCQTPRNRTQNHMIRKESRIVVFK